jgi:hypothetical protein
VPTDVDEPLENTVSKKHESVVVGVHPPSSHVELHWKHPFDTIIRHQKLWYLPLPNKNHLFKLL